MNHGTSTITTTLITSSIILLIATMPYLSTGQTVKPQLIYIGVNGSMALPCGTSSLTPCGNIDLGLVSIVSSNSTLYISEGMYSGLGNVNLSTPYINYDGPKYIQIIGVGEVIIDGENQYPIIEEISYVTDLTLTNIHFRNGRNDKSGGCVRLVSVSEEKTTSLVIFNGCYFDKCNSFGSGGAIYVDQSWDGNMYVYNSIFIQNKCVEFGGGIFFSNNTLVSVSDSTFTSNSAKRGGGLYLSHSKALVKSNVFEHNVAIESGGGASIRGSTLVTIDDNIFRYNQALIEDGGGLYLRNIYKELVTVPLPIGGNISRNLIEKNTANTQGGGIFMLNCVVDFYQNDLLFNSISVENTDLEAGQIDIFCQTNKPEFTNMCQFCTGEAVGTNCSTCFEAIEDNGACITYINSKDVDTMVCLFIGDECPYPPLGYQSWIVTGVALVFILATVLAVWGILMRSKKKNNEILKQQQLNDEAALLYIVEDEEDS
eukprot:TRINITY_DN6586_c0_g1_i2.p1 TRINITY_DN6586_c0_g1~~TRINITY_DN6586_c0_g1_i2.p1  ORF type:complete len:485 (-),score=86.14 TRINITY_DN6586_c0_g1_i2:40-1494(-)